MIQAYQGTYHRVWAPCTRPLQEGLQALLPAYGRPLIPGRFLRALQLGTQRAIVAGPPLIQRAIAHACARMPQPHGDHRTGPAGRLGGCGEAGQMVRDLSAEDCATMESGQRRRHGWQGGTLAVGMKAAQDHTKRVRMHA